MTTILRLAAAAALLGALGGCSMMPGWQPNIGGESPGVYESSPSD